MLNQAKFSCYFAGQDRLWRITNCWMQYYDVHTWSNVACVKRSSTNLATKMEDTFRRTLQDDKVWTVQGHHAGNNEGFFDTIMRTDQEVMTSKYI